MLNRGSLTGVDARYSGLTSNLAVMTEIFDIEKTISIISSNSNMHVEIDFSLFTNKEIVPFREVSIVTYQGVNAFYLQNHGLASGDEVSFISSGKLPSPITNDFFYAIPMDNNNFLVAKTKHNALASVGLNITDVGIGVHQCKVYIESEKYQRSWLYASTYIDSDLYNLRIKRVMNHFQSLGYIVNIISNPETDNSTFYWRFDW